MEVIVGEDQLSLAIGKKGQNVRLATRLVGWEIKIVSEELLKKEIAQQMGKMMASGEAVPLTALEGVTPSQAEVLAEKGIEDVETLAATTVDDLVEFLDVSLDEAEKIRAAAGSIVEARNIEIQPEEETSAGEPEAEADEDTTSEETSEPAPAEEIVEETEAVEEPAVETEVAEAAPEETEVVDEPVEDTPADEADAALEAGSEAGAEEATAADEDKETEETEG
jgi:N utilization substance protein A